VAGGCPSIVLGGGLVCGCRRLLQLRPRRCQHVRRVLWRYPEHGWQFGQADRMAVDQVEYLPVSARESVECCPDPAVTGGGERRLSVPMSGHIVVSGVEEG
jgi:hypothetical protein